MSGIGYVFGRRIHMATRVPIGILDVAGYYAPLLTFLDHAVASRFVRREHRDMLLVDPDPGRLLDRLAAHVPVDVEKWIDPTTI